MACGVLTFGPAPNRRRAGYQRPRFLRPAPAPPPTGVSPRQPGTLSERRTLRYPPAFLLSPFAGSGCGSRSPSPPPLPCLSPSGFGSGPIASSVPRAPTNWHWKNSKKPAPCSAKTTRCPTPSSSPKRSAPISASAFQSPSTRRTTEEFLRPMEADPTTPLAEHRELLRDFLQSCDLVKFARYQPTLTELEQVQQRATSFVTATKPVPSPGTKREIRAMSQFNFAHPWVLVLPAFAAAAGHLARALGQGAAIEYSGLEPFRYCSHAAAKSSPAAGSPRCVTWPSFVCWSRWRVRKKSIRARRCRKAAST